MPTDAQLLHDYLGRQLQEENVTGTAADVLADLESYSRQLERLRSLVREAEASWNQGHGRVLDVEALLERVQRRFAAERGEAT